MTELPPSPWAARERMAEGYANGDGRSENTWTDDPQLEQLAQLRTADPGAFAQVYPRKGLAVDHYLTAKEQAAAARKENS